MEKKTPNPKSKDGGKKSGKSGNLGKSGKPGKDAKPGKPINFYWVYAIVAMFLLTLVTLGLFLLLVNAAMIGLVSLFLHGFVVHGVWAAIGAAVVTLSLIHI